MFFEEENTYVRIDKYGKKILSSQGGSYTKPVVGSSELVSKLSIKLIMQRGIKLLDIRIQYEYTKATYTSQSFSVGCNVEKQEVAICMPEFKSIIVLKCSASLLSFLKFNEKHWVDKEYADKENKANINETNQQEFTTQVKSKSVYNNEDCAKEVSYMYRDSKQRIQQLKQRYRMNKNGVSKSSSPTATAQESVNRSVDANMDLNHGLLKSHYTPEKKKKCPNSNANTSPESKSKPGEKLGYIGNKTTGNQRINISSTLNDFIEEMKSESSDEYPNNIIALQNSMKVMDESASICGGHLFITGGAGTGKSFLLRLLLKHFLTQYSSQEVYATATTGISAFHIGGMTIHQFAGIRNFQDVAPETHDGAVEEFMKQHVSSSHTIVRRWVDTKVLIIDEVSMLSPQLLQCLDIIARWYRKSSLPMGGIRMVFCGDFFQLPPVRNMHLTLSQLLSRKDNDESQQKQQAISTSKSHLLFAFQAPLWKSLIPDSRNIVVLTKVHRQSDPEFIRILENVRWGKASDVTVLNQMCARQNDLREYNDQYGNCILPTKMTTRKKDVETINTQSLNSLLMELKAHSQQPSFRHVTKESNINSTQSSSSATSSTSFQHTYTSIDSGDKHYLSSLVANCPAKSELTLCVGAQVMLLKNIDVDLGLVNGARGVCIAFTRETKCPIVKFANNIEKIFSKERFPMNVGSRVVAQRLQIPLDLCWCMSVHKSQGISVDNAELDLKNIFEYGQAYVALSRVKSLSGLKLISPLQVQHIKAHPAVIDYYLSLKSENEV